MSERVVVIGSNSFSGSHFIARLMKDGSDVTGVSRSPEPHSVFLPYKWQQFNGSFEFHSLNLNRDLDEIVRLVEDVEPHYVVNYAAQGMVAQSWEDPEHWFQTNVVAMVGLHNRLRQCRGLRKYVHVTTPEVYGSTPAWVTEDCRFTPSTPYAVSRAACDMSLSSFWQAHEFPVVFTRSANVYGPGQQLYRVIPRAMLCGLLGRTFPMHGDGSSVRSFVYIDDVVDATARIMRQAPAGETYHISTRDTISIGDLVSRVCQILGVAWADVVEQTEDRLGKDQAYLLDSSKIRKELGWSDMVGLDRGLNVTLDWIQKHLEVLRDQSTEYVHKE